MFCQWNGGGGVVRVWGLGLKLEPQKAFAAGAGAVEGMLPGESKGKKTLASPLPSPSAISQECFPWTEPSGNPPLRASPCNPELRG